MLYKQTTRYARLKAFVVMPLSVTIAILFAINCTQSAIAHNKAGTTDVQKVSAPTPNVQPVEQSKPQSDKQDAKVVNGNPPSIPVPPPPPPPPAEKMDISLKNGVYTVVETMPQFPGGEEALQQYLLNNVKYPKEAKESGKQGVVYVSFIVEKDGSISNAKVIRKVDTSLYMEALRVVKAMPKWTPGKQKGKTVRVQFNLPISFKLK